MKANRLIHEKSPYLLQHAHNPVNWYPWGKEAFEAARSADKPIFLSIGYSTCHWCHVMERESFEDEETAALLNRVCVPIKVDREERPDIDTVYMSVCQALTGSGGWPLSILMTPDQKPFWAGTYLPKRRSHGQPGLMELLAQVETLWKNHREQLFQAGEQVAEHLAKQEAAPSAAPELELLQTAAAQFQNSFDKKRGGFGSAPKFPTPHHLLFLMEYARLSGDAEALSMAETTLTQMARGGLFDQIGGGFSRYSTDSKWLVPHFEKMLYDNALLAYAYLQAYNDTSNPYFRTIAERTLDYVLRELTGPDGEFYCGQDADSDGEEGKYYVFTPEEIGSVLSQEDGELFCNWFDITAASNFEGKSIPNLLRNGKYNQAKPEIDALCEKIYQYRLSRTALHRDDKVLTSWNALMIAALSKAYRVLGEPRYLDAANRAWGFLGKHLTGTDGRLRLRWRDGEAAHGGQLDDYAFLCWALQELYSAGFDPSCLTESARLAQEMEAHFLDPSGGFFLTSNDAENLIVRPKEWYDGAIPSGNSAAGLAFLQLWKLTGEPHWHKLADRQLSFLAGNIQEYPAGHSFALLALCRAFFHSKELVCVSSSSNLPEGLQKLAEKRRLTALFKTPSNGDSLALAAPFTQDYPIPKEGFAFYLCKNGSCQAPVFDMGQLKGLL